MPDSLEEKLRAFEERMRRRGDDSRPEPREEAVAEFVPKMPQKQEMLRFLDEADTWLNGEKRIDYLVAVTGGFGRQMDVEDLLHYPKSLSMIHRNLAEARRQGDKKIGRFVQMLFANERMFTPLANFFHWFWLVEQVEWAAQELSGQEGETLKKIRDAFQEFFTRRPEYIAALLQQGMIGRDLVLCEAVSEFRRDDSTDALSSAARPYPLTMQLLDIDDSDIARLVGKKVLDLGSGLSSFACSLRNAGIDAYTLDKFAAEELVDHARRCLKDAGVPLDAICSHLKIFEEPAFARNHQKGSAEDIPQIFGEGYFQQIFACGSITHPGLYLFYRKNPLEFWKSMYGAIRGLSPDHGRLRTSAINFLYTPTMMQKVILPFLIAMQAGRFEVERVYDREGIFSFERFMNTHFGFTERLQPKPPTLRIRRHPVSDPEKADWCMRKMAVEKIRPRELTEQFF